MKKFALIGFPVNHSYSKQYFSKKFKSLCLEDHTYELFEMASLNAFPALWLRHKNLKGLNVTVPHKEDVLKYLDKLDAGAMRVNAANVIHKKQDKLIGYNTDYIAFRNSLKKWIGAYHGEALILGSGGSAKAVQAGLEDLDIPHTVVSRKSSKGDYTYDQLIANPSIIRHFQLIVNTTPLGLYPNLKSCPDIPYDRVRPGSFFYDLVYNPTETQFLKQGKKRKIKIKNGQEMLELQAELSWKIWNS